ncbi:MAG: endo-1,4-beta-xylanase [Treponema sp.]|nr:endo-1,4-beta-xylanase [Treponema sp.]
MKKTVLQSSLVICIFGAFLLLSSCCSNKSASKTTVSPEVSEILPWLEAPSLKETYKDIFENIGVAVNYNELRSSDVLEGLEYHFSSVTMENEFKPQFMFNWQAPNTKGTFTSSKGVTITVPTNIPDFSRMDTILKVCKTFGLKLRGHVLVWHSQTEKSFFRENYKPTGAYVDKETMDARQEWYIKSILEHVKEWEEKNNDNQRIIYAWDVVNEAVSDGANANNYLRQNDSDWYKIYQNEDFIVNAFRYANKYAPSDVQLAYNDYNCAMGNKTAGILKVIDAIKATEDDDFLPGRIDVIGMQSHVDTMNPSTTSIDIAIRKFLEKGVDIHITELDVAGSPIGNEKMLRFRYKELFKTYAKYTKKDGGNGISGITLWGLNDERSWIAQKNGVTQCPLLFTHGNKGYMTKSAFYGAIEAAKEQ